MNRPSTPTLKPGNSNYTEQFSELSDMEEEYSEEENNGFETPNKRHKQGRQSLNQPLFLVNFVQENQFAPLSQEEENPGQNKPRPTGSPKTGKLPALFVYNIRKQFEFIKSMKHLCKEVPTVLNTSDGLKFHFKIMPDFEKIETLCVQQKIEHATERPKQERPLKIVIR